MVRHSKGKEGIPPDQPKESAVHLVPRLRGCMLILVKTLLGLSITLHSAPAPEAVDIAYATGKRNIELYGHRVFIADGSESLSIPQDTLQWSKVPRVIKQNLVNKCMEMSPGISEKKDHYNEFFHGRTDVVILMDSEALYDICFRYLDSERSTFNCFRRLALIISSLITLLRFDGALNLDITELQTSRVPYPRFHFMLTSYVLAGKASHKQLSAAEITMLTFEPSM